MSVAAFELIDYKSFADSGEVQFEPGFNVIVGQNNVGKMAMAEALSLRFDNSPHLSTGTVPTPLDEPKDSVSRN